MMGFRSLKRIGLLAVALMAGVAAFTFNSPSRAADAEGIWTRKAPMPMARTEVAVAAVDDKLYVIGGSTADIDGLTIVQEYDPATDKWRDRAPIPQGLNHMAATALNGKIYTVGGFSGRTPNDTGGRLHQGATTYAFEYDPKTDKWRTLPSLKGPRGSVGVVALDGKIHAVGGRNLEVKTVTTHEVYDPTTDKWSDAAPLPTARDHLAAVAADGLLHVIGGRFDGRDENASNHDIYNPKTNTWTAGPPLPTARSGLQSTFYMGKILVVGGETSKYANTENEAFDVKSGKWLKLAPVPLGLHASAGAAIGDHAYFPGGSSKQGGDAITNQLLVFTLPK
jgi:N-acetylneuraminic acid mutarotase